MADGIAMYRFECKADVIAFVVDGITTGSYLSLSSMFLIRTSSHACERWYLPMFLLSHLYILHHNPFLYCSSWMTKISSTHLFHRLGGCGAVAWQ